MEKKYILTGVEKTSKGDKEANNRTQGGSLVGCGGSTFSSCQDVDCNYLFNGDKRLAGGDYNRQNEAPCHAIFRAYPNSSSPFISVLSPKVFLIKLAASGSATSTDLEFLGTGESYSGKPIIDPGNLWKARTVVGQRVQYCVEWELIWHFGSELEGMEVLMDEFDIELYNLQVTAPNKLWEGTIIGRRITGGRRQYCVEWKPTWEPELELAKVKELIDEFMANRKNNQYRGRERAQKRSWAGTEHLDIWSQLEASKRQRQARNQ
ncbi:hypothetical protein BGZ60DRAFT_437101 [Tricladium varicosporioides]|nr:hypothetical protein BGZ60DRAFT_437101 [Hymenoscyphus varicosporioides]